MFEIGLYLALIIELSRQVASLCLLKGFIIGKPQQPIFACKLRKVFAPALFEKAPSQQDGESKKTSQGLMFFRSTSLIVIGYFYCSRTASSNKEL